MKLHGSCSGHNINTLCLIILDSEALIGFCTIEQVSSNLALSGAMYSFELKARYSRSRGIASPLTLVKMFRLEEKN